LILEGFSCSCGLPHCFIHTQHLSCCVLGLGKAKKSTPPSKLLGYQLSDLQVPYAHRFGILLSAESLTGLLYVVTVANVGLDRSRLWEGLSEGSIIHVKVLKCSFCSFVCFGIYRLKGRLLLVHVNKQVRQCCQVYDNYRICTIILPCVQCAVNNPKKGQIYDNFTIL